MLNIVMFVAVCDVFIFTFFFLMIRPPPISTLFPYTTLFRSVYIRDFELKTDLDAEYRDATFGISVTLERSEEHTSELQSQFHLVCRLLLEKKNECSELRWSYCNHKSTYFASYLTVSDYVPTD